MFENLDPKKVDDIIQRALDVIQNHKSAMLNLRTHLDLKNSIVVDDQGTPHLRIRGIEFTEGWQNFPIETFRGTGRFHVLEQTDTDLVVYYQISGGSHFVLHSVDVPFTTHICYGTLNCTVSGGTLQKGATGEAEANRLHQLCFPENTGMIITFNLR